MCVCNIWIDVKLRCSVTSNKPFLSRGCRAQWKLHPTKLSTCAGSRVWSTLCTCRIRFELLNKLSFYYFAIIAWEWRGAKPSTPCNYNHFISSRLPQSAFFAETMSPMYFWVFRRTCRRWYFLIILGTLRRNIDIIIFLELQHAGQLFWILV